MSHSLSWAKLISLLKHLIASLLLGHTSIFTQTLQVRTKLYEHYGSVQYKVASICPRSDDMSRSLLFLLPTLPGTFSLG